MAAWRFLTTSTLCAAKAACSPPRPNGPGGMSEAARTRERRRRRQASAVQNVLADKDRRPLWQARRARRWTGEPETPCCDVRLSVHVVTNILMSEMPPGDTHDVIHHGGQVVTRHLPIGRYARHDQ